MICSLNPSYCRQDTQCDYYKHVNTTLQQWVHTNVLSQIRAKSYSLATVQNVVQLSE